MAAQNLAKNPSGRRHERTKLRARLKLTHASLGSVVVYSADLSDGGLFALQAEHALPDVGEIVQLQVQDVPVEAPILHAKVVRKNEDGIGVMFLEPEAS